MKTDVVKPELQVNNVFIDIRGFTLPFTNIFYSVNINDFKGSFLRIHYQVIRIVKGASWFLTRC